MKYLCLNPDTYESGETVVYLEAGREYAESELPDPAVRERLLASGRLLERPEPQPQLEPATSKPSKGGK